MDIPIRNSDLRKALADIGVYPHEYYGIVEDIGRRPGHGHQIERVNPQPIWPAAGTCLPFALGLTERLEFYDLTNRVRVGAASRFVRWLHHHRHLRQQEEITDRCLVLYFIGDHKQEVWKHAGVGAGTNRVISKWGDGLVLRHPIDQVPSDYGFTVRAYEHPGSRRAMQLFRGFVDDCDQLPPWARPT